jgi:plasmid stabilization system protein ParE
MSGFVLHPDALNDLNEIWNFIAVDNLAAADRFVQEINDTIRAVLPFPQMGHSRPDLTSRPIRFLSVRDL